MQIEPNYLPGEMLRRAMRRWVTGVSIVTSRLGEVSHGMTVNSFGSISLDPPLVTVTMSNDTRTFHLVQETGVFAVTVLSAEQQEIAELFAGRGDPAVDRMAGVPTFKLLTGAPLIEGGIAFVDCRVAAQHPMLNSTLLIGEVLAAQTGAASLQPLVYYNRTFGRFG